MLLDAKAILAAGNDQMKTVKVPEWGGEVLIGIMGALDAARLNDWLDSLPKRDEGKEDEKDGKIRILTTDSPGGEPEIMEDEDEEQDSGDEIPEAKKYTRTQQTELMLRYLTACILDPSTYQPAFTIEKIEELGRKDGRVLGRIYREILDLHGMTEKSAEEIEKNSAATPSGGSGSA